MASAGSVLLHKAAVFVGLLAEGLLSPWELCPTKACLWLRARPLRFRG